jgi:hypothetical protein
VADTLLSLLSGQAPLAPQQLPGYLGAQMAAGTSDTSGTTGGLLGAIANGLKAGVGSSMLKNAVGNTTQAGLAAQPDTLAAYASPQGPLGYAAQNPGMNKLSLAQILAQSQPGTGQAGALSAINVMRYRQLNNLDPTTGQPMPGAVAPMAQSLIGAPSVGSGAARMPPPAGVSNPGFPQGYNGRAQPAAGGEMQQVVSQLATARTPPERAAILQRLPPDQLQALRAQFGGAGSAAQP